METVYFLVTYRRKIKITRGGRTVFFKSRKVEVDCFASTGCRRDNLTRAFNRAEADPLFKSGWSVMCLPIDEGSFKRRYEQTRTV
jgi:hypothetical protein